MKILKKETIAMGIRKDVLKIAKCIVQKKPEEIWVVSANVLIAKKYWGRLIEIVPEVFKIIKPRFISSRETMIMGLNSQNTIILKCGPWWKNPIYKSNLFKQYIKDAKQTFSISELP
ncbi:hypothetical protein LAV35_03630 [Clostridium sporogenes]|uniref:hypothetical protein n=1 Tax=Clostridium sporogenes TaxID=1509 RepID=UPI002237CDEC|nr:hypothetical protein [Clostridium sporogenes]MCW6059772.1 hypothetical protein [Clostridium sporogenes]MCW6067275.1 hypothetical protein [Clostridium sporogenes]